VADKIWDWYARDGAWRWRGMHSGEIEVFANGEHWIRSGYATLDEIRASVIDPMRFELILNRPATPALPYTDADVDRLVEMQWAVQVSAHGGDWSRGAAGIRAGLMDAWTVEARAFLSDYAQYKAARAATVAGQPPVNSDTDATV
jgi:hypothetical protein